MKVFDLRQTTWDIVGDAVLWPVLAVVLAIDAAACAGGWVVRKVVRS